MGVRGAMVARLEPSGFTVLLPGLDRVEAFKSASALKNTLEGQSRAWNIASLDHFSITVSVGVAALEPRGASPFTNVQMLFLAAQHAAEAASTGEGNCVRMFTPRAAAA
jgi:GGDEF domain-containing protein